MPIIHDDEFGKVIIRRSARASQVRLRVGPDGSLRASLPLYAPTFLVKRLIKTSRPQLRELLTQSIPETAYHDGMVIGKSHRLVVQAAPELSVVRKKQDIIVSLPESLSLKHPTVVKQVREAVIAALRVEAKSYLPKRLQYLSEQRGLHYEKVRFSHASGRWGSCSSKGTISLNIALMKLPFELIDYVIVHELAHTVQMNHSAQFWALVAGGDPDYKIHRRQLRNEAPSI